MPSKTKIATQIGLSITLMMAGAAAFAQSKEFTASCSTSGFTGTAYLNGYKTPGGRSFLVHDYKINAPGDSQSRSSANMNVQSYNNATHHSSAWNKSGDDLKQDGVTRPISLGAGTAGDHLNTAIIEFIFDKSGNDPRCTAKVQMPLGG